jgi:uncharacterized protein YigE (DUF2233 family)
MRLLIAFYFLITLAVLSMEDWHSNQAGSNHKSEIVFYEINPKNQDLRFFWKDEKGEVFKSEWFVDGDHQFSIQIFMPDLHGTLIAFDDL